MVMNFVFPTTHAIRQSARRGVSLSDAGFAVRFGRQLHRDGLLFKFVGWREVIRHSLPEKAEGVTAVLSGNGKKLITVYRNPRAIAKIRKKPERTWVRRKQFLGPPSVEVSSRRWNHARL